MQKVAVVGAGISGLSAAYELKKAGYDVTVFEKESFVGGRMSTRKKDGFAFDVGANFFVTLYKHTFAYAKEFNISIEPMPGQCATWKDGELHPLSLGGLIGLLRYKMICLRSRINLLLLFIKSKKLIRELDFFDLSSAKKELDFASAYDYAKARIGKDAADLLVDGFTSTYQFHRASEISTTAMFGLISLMASDSNGFTICHAKGEMSAIPEALAKQLKVNLNTEITKVEKKKDIEVTIGKKIQHFDKAIIASTADMTKRIYKNPTADQKSLLDKVRYATTINVSFKIPKDILKGKSILTVPYCQSNVISEYTNEVHKSQKDGICLVNMGLHEEFAKKIFEKSDKGVFEIVKKEFIRVCPGLKCREDELRPHDLIRWQSAMPKYMHNYVKDVRDFWQEGQGGNNIYFCGDYLNAPWVEGSIICGKKVAKMIMDKKSK